MKKILKILLKSILIFIAAVFLLLLIIPTFFKDTIKEKVVEQANKSINAKLSFDDFSLSLIRNFPNLSFRLEEVEIVGNDKFEGETLAGFKSFGFVFDLSSLFGKNGYSVKSIILDSPLASAIILEDGSANWDIVKESVREEPLAESTIAEAEKDEKEGKELKVNLERIEIRKANISFTDYSSGLKAGLGSLNLNISGNFSESLTNLVMSLLIENIDVYMKGERYLNSATVKGKFDISADLDNQVFTFNNNSFGLNDLVLFLNGTVGMSESEITTKLELATGDTEFKQLLSMVPAFYMNDFKELETRGSVKLDISVDGAYNTETSDLPDVEVLLSVNGGTVWFKDQAELVSDLNIKTNIALNSSGVKGNMDVSANKIDLGGIINLMPSDTLEPETDTTALEMDLVKVPENIDFEFTSLIQNLLFNSLDATDLQSHILVRDSKLMVDETGLKTLGGEISLTALYNSQDLSHPFMNASITAEGIGIKDSYDRFTTVQKLAPVAEGMDGTASVLFEFDSELQQDMMPDLNSINGMGRFRSEEIQLVNSTLFNKFSALLNIDDKFSNTFKDIDVEFKIMNGRVYFNDFETELGNIGLAIGGDHGLDQSINYMVSSAIPASEMPSSLNTLISGLAAQAALFGIKYSPPEVYNVNIGIEGTVKDPKFKPSMGEPGKGAGATVKESVKAVVSEKVEEVKETIREEAAEQAENIMIEAEKQAETIKSEASKAAQTIRDEAGVNAQKLIDEAEGKGPLAKIAAKKAADVLVKEADKKAAKLEEEAAGRADNIIADARKKIEEKKD